MKAENIAAGQALASKIEHVRHLIEQLKAGDVAVGLCKVYPNNSWNRIEQPIPPGFLKMIGTMTVIYLTDHLIQLEDELESL